MMAIQNNRQNKSATESDDFEQERSIMAFVSELVPEEQKTKFDQKVFHSPWTPTQALEPYKWVIDRDRYSAGWRSPVGRRECPKAKAIFGLELEGGSHQIRGGI